VPPTPAEAVRAALNAVSPPLIALASSDDAPAARAAAVDALALALSRADPSLVLGADAPWLDHHTPKAAACASAALSSPSEELLSAGLSLTRVLVARDGCFPLGEAQSRDILSALGRAAERAPRPTAELVGRLLLRAPGTLASAAIQDCVAPLLEPSRDSGAAAEFCFAPSIAVAILPLLLKRAVAVFLRLQRGATDLESAKSIVLAAAGAFAAAARGLEMHAAQLGAKNSGEWKATV